MDGKMFKGRDFVRDVYVNFQKIIALKSKKVFRLMKRSVKNEPGRVHTIHLCIVVKFHHEKVSDKLQEMIKNGSHFAY